MKLHRPRVRQAQDNSLIPLINVVFLMLAFFMIAGQIAPSDAIRLNPPDSLSPRLQEADAVTLLVTKNQALFLHGRPVREEQLTAEIRRLLAESTERENLRVLVKADADLPAVELRKILSRLRAGGLLRVSLGTESTTRT